jgi:tetratricopeptide (TPR) repeat protein
MGHIDRALRDYPRALEILDRHAGPTSLVARFQRAQYIQALNHAGRVDEAGEVMRALEQTLPPQAPPSVADFDATVYQALALAEAGNGREAQRLLERFKDNWLEFGRRFGPNGSKWVVELALAHALQGQPVRAREALGRIKELPSHYGVSAGSSPEYAGEAALVALVSADLDGAARELEKAAETIRERPEYFSWIHARLWAFASHIELSRGEPQRALELADSALEHLRKHAGAEGFPFIRARALAARGDALLALDRAREAQGSLEGARELMARLHSPQSPWRLMVSAALTRAYVAQQDLPTARARLEEARTIARRNPTLPTFFLQRLTQAQRALDAPRS